MKKLTYFKRYDTALEALKAANRHKGAITDADVAGYKTGFIAYSTRKKIRGWKSKKIDY